MQIAQAYNGSIAGVAFLWVVLLPLIAGGCWIGIQRCCSRISTGRKTTLAIIGTLWVMHVAVCKFTIGQLLMFHNSIAIEMSKDEGLKELILLVKGSALLLCIATVLLIIVTCVGLNTIIARMEIVESPESSAEK